MIKLKINIVLFVIASIFVVNKSYSQSGESVRAMWIFNIASSVTWENQNSVSKFTIGVFSSQKEYDEIKKFAETSKIHGKPVEVVQYLNYQDVKPNNIIYVTKNENANLGLIYENLKGENVLIISDRSHQPQYGVINFNKTNSKQPFTINTSLYKTQRLKFSLALLRIGGDREELKNIQEETNKKLIEAKRNIEFKDMEIEVLKEKLRKCEDKNKDE